LGYLGITIPKKYGGLELGPIEAIIAIEEMARACANTAEVVFDCNIGPIQVIQHFGTDEQRERYLRRAARGEILMGIAISERHAGSGATDMHSRAKFDGDSVVLNGRKAYVEDVSTQNAFLVYIKFDDRPGAKSIGGVLVEKGTPGFSVGTPRKKMGLRGCAQADLIFENCRVPRENVVIHPGDFTKLMEAFNLERCGNAIMAVGIASAALDEAIAYAKTREQFGQPIANYQAIQWMLADMATELEAARMLTLKAAAAKDRQEKSAFEASMAKLAASEAAHKAADKAMQIFASAGYRRGSVVERLFRDVRATEIYQGTSEAQRMIIAANVLANA
jgi:butyryl-CoA dehydrogenase